MKDASRHAEILGILANEESKITPVFHPLSCDVAWRPPCHRD